MASAEIQRSGSQLSGLSSGWSKPSKQEGKDREGREQAVDSLFDRKRVPLEALVRKSSPIAMVKKEEPAEPQVHAFVWDFVALLWQTMCTAKALT